MAKSRREMRKAFWEFHRANPRVWKLLVKFAFEAYDAGMRRIGIAFLIERIRWEEEVVRRTDGYKINNNHKPFYSRRLMRKHPELNGLFVTRKRTST